MAMTRRVSLGIAAAGALLATTGMGGAQQDRSPSGDRPEVTQAVIETWKQELTNWGRWGADDEVGTLNLITPQTRRQAAALVRSGVSVSLARDAETEESRTHAPTRCARSGSPPTRFRSPTTASCTPTSTS